MLPSSSFEAGLLNNIIGRCYFRGLVDACGLVKERRPWWMVERVAENSAPLKKQLLPTYLSLAATTTSAETSETANQHNCGCFVGEDIASYEMYGR